MSDPIRTRQRQLDQFERLSVLFGRGVLFALVVIGFATVLNMARPIQPEVLLALAGLGGGFWGIARWGSRTFAKAQYAPQMDRLLHAVRDYADGLGAGALYPATDLPDDRQVLAEAVLHRLRDDPDGGHARLLVTLARHRPELTAPQSLQPPATLDAETRQMVDQAADGTNPDRLASLLTKADDDMQGAIRSYLSARLAEADAQAEADALRRVLTLPGWQWRAALDRFFAAEAASETAQGDAE
ncbi:MAG: hypothetical protein Alpg2KO_26550 [Alphaproteobacteria bacterium]